MTIGLIGMGAMGRRMARRLSEAGHSLRIYSRSAEHARLGAALGAAVVSSPRAAAEGAQLVLSMVSDDAASKQVWLGDDDGAVLGVQPDCLAVECSTLSQQWALELATELNSRRLRFLEAPVLGTLPQAEAGKLVVVAGGNADDLDQARPALGAFAAKTLHIGGQGQGTAFKLVANGLLALQVAGLAELLQRAASMGLSRSRSASLLAQLPLTSPAAESSLQLMASGAHPDWFPVKLIAKDMRYLGSAPGAGVLSGTRAAFEAAEQAGHGERHLTAVSDWLSQTEG